MTLKRALIVVVLTFLAALAGCGASGTDPNPDIAVPAADLDVTYVVTGVTVEDRTRALVDGTEIRIRFAEDRVTLTAGCNTMSGKYLLDGTRLTVEPLAMTEMGCDEPRMAQDTWLAGLFAKPVQLTTGENATLVSGAAVLALTDREQASPDKPLVGTKWVLDTVAESGPDGTASSVPAGYGAFIRIEGTRVTGNDGCNGWGGEARVEPKTLTFGRLGMTDVGCGSPQEAFRAVLNGTVTYAIEEDRLTVTKEGNSLGFHADS